MTVKVIGTDLPKRDYKARKVTADLVDEVRAETPNWCNVLTYGTKNSASSAAARARERYPDVHFASRTIDGEPTLIAKYDPNDPPTVKETT